MMTVMPGLMTFDFLEGFYPAHSGHANIHENQIEKPLLDPVHSHLAIASLFN